MNPYELVTLATLARARSLPLRSGTAVLWETSRTTDRSGRGNNDGPRAAESHGQAQGKQLVKALHRCMLRWGVYDILQLVILGLILYLLVRNGG